ncbi:MAG: chromosome segregation protein SMC, partial [Nitriliruptoraceae bacterium]
AWVLGTHSAKKVRGGSMSDVIFAGSPTRSRATQSRVEIVIDNSDGQLQGGVGTAASAAEFSEVRIARVIHHDGETTYEINGAEVRALDVQELLSDTGLGRELHTIVGQGQLDEILNAKPEERRRYIEEAAGILKHRRRRERAVRKLEQVDEHIDKLQTVLRELRRQLRPLERQAEAADKHAALQAELREVRVARAARELHRLTEQVDEQRKDSDATAAKVASLESALEECRARVTALDERAARLAQDVERYGGIHHALASLRERIRGTADLIDAKRRHLVEYVDEPLAGRPPADLRAHAERIDTERAEREADQAKDRQRLDAAVAARREAETARRDHEQAVQADRRRRAEQRERLVRWEGEVSALRGAIASAESELGRVTASLTSLDARITEAERESAGVQEEIQRLDVREVELTDALEDAEAALAERDAELEALRDRMRDLDAQRVSHAARAEALRAALAESDAGTAALLARTSTGVLGRVADHVRVDPDAAVAVAAALGQVGEAVVVGDRDQARDAISWLRSTSSGRAVVIAAAPADGADQDELAVDGARPLTAFVHPADDRQASSRVVHALRRWLRYGHLVDDWETAVRLHTAYPSSSFVTPDGDVAGPDGYRAAGSEEHSAVATAAAAEVAEDKAQELADELETLALRRRDAEAAVEEARRDLALATERINESDARITGAAERLARLNKELHSLTTQREVVDGQRGELEQVLERDRAALSELHGRGPVVDDEDAADAEGGDPAAVELDEAVERAREAELDARVKLERTTEQVRHLELQAETLRREADEVETALADAARRRELRRQGIERCGELAVIARAALDALDGSIDEAEQARSNVATELDDVRAKLATARDEEQRLAAERDTQRESRHAADLRRAQAANQLEALEARLRSQLSLNPDDVRAEHPDPSEYDDDELSQREDVLVRKLGLLGRVNPLALEEFNALEERHAFLSDQLDDLRRSRRDLEEVISAVDDRIRVVFKEAFDDVAREFEQTFATVFPGGRGRLVMTDADDLLRAGVDVEARPPGKRVTRLSLLSGGERSLTVLAFVFAIFRARPSPFYVLDEVDAALDDVNLQRLLRVVFSFKGAAQVIMVTHQKRTMEIADVLYGITMGADGVTKVVAERLDDVDEVVLEGRTADVDIAYAATARP